MHSIGQHFIGGFDGTKITPSVKELIQKYHIGGFILFRRNIKSVAQVRGLVAKLQRQSKTPLFIGVDQEGGNVFRLGKPFTQLPSMAVVGNYYRRTKNIRDVQKVGQILGAELKAVGVNWDYAPVVDVHSNPKNPIIKNRSFGPDPKLVTRCAEALIKGLHKEGVLSCVKHFPGHGATSADSHLELPIVRSSGRLLWRRDLWPFRKLITSKRVATLMTAHVKYPALDGSDCATLSHSILTDLLRKRMKYRGIIISDDFFMKAISDEYGIPDASYRFFKAGGDLALICKDPKVQMKAIEHVTKLAKKDRTLQKHFQQSQKRIQKIKGKFLYFS